MGKRAGSVYRTPRETFQLTGVHKTPISLKYYSYEILHLDDRIQLRN
jgi:hypothetical protein